MKYLAIVSYEPIISQTARTNSLSDNRSLVGLKWEREKVSEIIIHD